MSRHLTDAVLRVLSGAVCLPIGFILTCGCLIATFSARTSFGNGLLSALCCDETSWKEAAAAAAKEASLKVSGAGRRGGGPTFQDGRLPPTSLPLPPSPDGRL